MVCADCPNRQFRWRGARQRWSGGRRQGQGLVGDDIRLNGVDRWRLNGRRPLRSAGNDSERLRLLFSSPAVICLLFSGDSELLRWGYKEPVDKGMCGLQFESSDLVGDGSDWPAARPKITALITFYCPMPGPSLNFSALVEAIDGRGRPGLLRDCVGFDWVVARVARATSTARTMAGTSSGEKLGTHVPSGPARALARGWKWR